MDAHLVTQSLYSSAVASYANEFGNIFVLFLVSCLVLEYLLLLLNISKMVSITACFMKIIL